MKKTNGFIYANSKNEASLNRTQEPEIHISSPSKDFSKAIVVKEHLNFITQSHFKRPETISNGRRRYISSFFEREKGVHNSAEYR